MIILHSTFSANQVEMAIRMAISSLKPAVDTIDSDQIIPILLGKAKYVQDYGIPACLSKNAAIGRDIRAVGEDYGIIKKNRIISKKLNGTKTTLTRYSII